MQASILTPYVWDDQAEDPHWVPLLSKRYPLDAYAAHNCPGNLTPNVVFLEVRCQDSILEQISADPDFYIVEAV